MEVGEDIEAVLSTSHNQFSVRATTIRLHSSYTLLQADEDRVAELLYSEVQRMNTDHGGLCLHLTHISDRLWNLWRTFLPSDLPADPDRVV